MTDAFLKFHAISNVWCSPPQDKQFIIQAAKLTPLNGVKRNKLVMWRNISLPDNESYWHIYQVGQLHPVTLGLLPISEKWVSFSTACNDNKMIVDIYTKDGVNLPRFTSHYMYTKDKALIFAVKVNKNIPIDFEQDKIYVRVYSNAYFNSVRSNPSNDFVFVKGIEAKNQNDILTLQNEYNDYKTKPGLTYCFVNGQVIDSISLINMKVGDVGEFVYDSSIIKTVEFKIDDLLTFTSTLDNKEKYLLHYSGVDNETIDFFDDVDIFIQEDRPNNRFRGLYYHKNKVDSFRNLTHRDYSIVSSYVSAYMSKFNETKDDTRIIDIKNLKIKLHIRKSGFVRPLIYDHNRIKELYKMSDTDIVRSILGIDSTVSNWRAEVLESSEYCEIMRIDCCDITSELIENAYGYNSIAKLTADIPQNVFIESSQKQVDVPYLMRMISTAYEYDSSGKYLGNYKHINGERYRCSNPTAMYVEFIRGFGSTFLSESFGQDEVTVDVSKDYRVYYCNMLSGGPDDNWVETTDSGKYTIISDKIRWLDNTIDPYIRVRHNSSFYKNDYDIDLTDGKMEIVLQISEDRNGFEFVKNMTVPLGEMDLFLNGYSLIKDLDYFVDFPRVIITNKKFLLNSDITTKQKVHVRMTGFCDSDFKLTQKRDYGFVEHGFLSNNFVYDLRDDRVVRITVDGLLKTKEQLKFSEEHSGVSIINIDNGKPYLVKDIVTPMYGIIEQDTYEFKQKSEVVDKKVADYLTLKIPQPVRPAPSAITNRYELFSPFICKIIFDLKNNILDISDLGAYYSDNTVINKCVNYNYLLAFDPIREENSVNDNYVIIHPHFLSTIIDLPLLKYRFIQNVVRIYSRGLVQINSFLTLTP
jgi:hypothetical protein